MEIRIRLVIAMSWLRNLQLGNVCKETFCVRSGNVAKTFWRENALGHIYACLRTYVLPAVFIHVSIR